MHVCMFVHYSFTKNYWTNRHEVYRNTIDYQIIYTIFPTKTQDRKRVLKLVKKQLNDLVGHKKDLSLQFRSTIAKMKKKKVYRKVLIEVPKPNLLGILLLVVNITRYFWSANSTKPLQKVDLMIVPSSVNNNYCDLYLNNTTFEYPLKTCSGNQDRC